MNKALALLAIGSTALAGENYVEYGFAALWPAPYARIGHIEPIGTVAELDTAVNFAWGLLVYPSVSGSMGVQFKSSDCFSWGPEGTLGLTQVTTPYGHAGVKFKWRTDWDRSFNFYVGMAPYVTYHQWGYEIIEKKHVAPTVSFGWSRSF